MGRRTYEYLATRWTVRTGPWADRLRALPKYLVTSTGTDLTWANSFPLTGDDEYPEAIE